MDARVSSVTDLDQIAREVRGTVIELSHRGRAAHLASSLSCVDILVAAYWHAMNIDPASPKDPERDRFILSKGHAAQALYAVLAKKGFFGQDLLDGYNQEGGLLAEHPGPDCAPGVEAATGSLGHGLSIGVGLAMGARLTKRAYKTYVVLSDGECNEGSVWEAAMMAAARKLENLCVVVDFNKWQATDRSQDVMALDPLREKWQAFGWQAIEVDGHDIAELTAALDQFAVNAGAPSAIVAHTVKGKGVSFMEDDNNWHYRIPTTEEVARAREELGLT